MKTARHASGTGDVCESRRRLGKYEYEEEAAEGGSLRRGGEGGSQIRHNTLSVAESGVAVNSGEPLTPVGVRPDRAGRTPRQRCPADVLG